VNLGQAFVPAEAKPVLKAGRNGRQECLPPTRGDPIMSANRRRPAFTLVELLVVIAILGILAGLLYAGIQAVWRKKPMVTTTTEIREMVEGLEAFKAKYGVYPPSYLSVDAQTTAQSVNKLGPNSAKAKSFAILTKIWPNIDFSQAFASLPVKTIEGDQCLVLFLGGYYATNPLTGQVEWFNGFSTNPYNPFEVTIETDLVTKKKKIAARTQPFFKFDPSRIYKRSGQALGSYGDGWFETQVKDGSTPPQYVASKSIYAYFSAQNGAYNFNSQDGYPYNLSMAQTGSSNDCATLTDDKGKSPLPYFEADATRKDALGNRRWIMPDSFQIHSPGADTYYRGPSGGSTNAWSTTNNGTLSTYERDNLTNFTDGMLGN
jgi:prepilin-type N-terminal cleavage/methylation domain-containing protein